MYREHNEMKKLYPLLIIITLFSCQRENSKKVIIIGIDALSTDGIQVATTPNLNELISDGAFTLNARGVMPTVSSPNWSSMLYGATPEQHGVTKNGWTTNNHTIEPIVADKEGYFPSIFALLKEEMPDQQTAIFYDWKELINLLNKKYIDKIEYLSDYEEVFDMAIPYIIESKPALTFIYVGHVDHIGHSMQHGSNEYYKSIEEVDAKVGKLISALKSAKQYENTFIMVISDHGGVGYGHGGESMAEIEVPWILKGPGIIKNRMIQEPVNTYYTASTIAHIFGIKQHEYWVGHPVLGAFKNHESSTINQKTYLPKPATSVKSGIYLEPAQLSMVADAKNAEIRFTRDGSKPTKNSTLYTTPIDLEKTEIIKAVAFKDTFESNVSIVEFMKLNEIKSVQLLSTPSTKYPAGQNGLLLYDLNKTNNDFKHHSWIGYEKNDFEVIVDLGEIKSINKVSIRCLKNEHSWIFLPNQLTISTSTNGKEFETVAVIEKSEIEPLHTSMVSQVGKPLENIKSRYIKIRARNIGFCPPNHPGNGEKAWLFVDEVMIE